MGNQRDLRNLPVRHSAATVKLADVEAGSTAVGARSPATAFGVGAPTGSIGPKCLGSQSVCSVGQLVLVCRQES